MSTDNYSTDSFAMNSSTPPQGSGLFLVVLNVYTVPILFGLVTVLGVAGNSLVIYVILAKERMRTITNLLLLNLAFADLSFVLVIPPFTAHQIVAASWPLGDPLCRLMHYLVNVTAYVTVYTLVLISVIRYMTVVHSVRTAQIRSRTNVVVMIVTIWVVMLMVNSPVLMSYSVVENERGLTDCDITDHSVGQALFGAFFVFAYLLPLGVIGMFSVAILRHIHRNKPLAFKNRTEDRKKQVGRMLILVVVIFALSWMPVHIHILVFFFGTLPDNDFYRAVSVLWNCLAYFNSCVNPIIYNHTSKDFRDAFREAVCRGSSAAASSSSSSPPGRRSPKQEPQEVLLQTQQQQNTNNV